MGLSLGRLFFVCCSKESCGVLVKHLLLHQMGLYKKALRIDLMPKDRLKFSYFGRLIFRFTWSMAKSDSNIPLLNLPRFLLVYGQMIGIWQSINKGNAECFSRKWLVVISECSIGIASKCMLAQTKSSAHKLTTRHHERKKETTTTQIETTIEIVISSEEIQTSPIRNNKNQR